MLTRGGDSQNRFSPPAEAGDILCVVQSSAFNKQRRFAESVPAQSEIVLRLFGQIEPAACRGGGYPLCCYKYVFLVQIIAATVITAPTTITAISGILI